MQPKQVGSTTQNEPSKMMISCFRASSRVSRFLSTVAVAPEGLQPYWRAFIYELETSKAGHTGTEYRIFGLGLSTGQFSRMSRREADCMPSPSVPTSDKTLAWDSVQVEGRPGRTNQRAAMGFEHRNDTTENCFSWVPQREKSRHSRVHRGFHQDRVARIQHRVYSLRGS